MKSVKTCFRRSLFTICGLRSQLPRQRKAKCDTFPEIQRCNCSRWPILTAVGHSDFISSKSYTHRAMTRKKLIIDCDAGIDDAHAIFMAIQSASVEVLAITTCHGNADTAQVGLNVLRVLQAADRLDIPVYQGASTSLVGREKNHTIFYHGLDGLGDVPDVTAPGPQMIRCEHSATVIPRLVKQHTGEITLVCLAPLTNIALALRLDPEFAHHLKECFIMGGNYEGKGNITPSAEFNFHSDPEAAAIVLAELCCPKTLVCWELCLKHALPWSTYNELRSGSSQKTSFLKKVESKTMMESLEKGWDSWIPCDEIAMAVAIPGDMITHHMRRKVKVITVGECEGQMVVMERVDEVVGEQGVAYIVLEIDEIMYMDILKRAVQH